jgi:hypothetical protein
MMIDIMNWIADHFWGTLLFLWLSGEIVAKVVRAFRVDPDWL